MTAGTGGKKAAFVLRIIELVFSIIVLSTAAAWINVWSEPNVNFALFVGVTSMIICGVFIFFHLSAKTEIQKFSVIELILTFVYWVFWLAAAAATASSVSAWNACGWWVLDCGNSRLGALRACCSFCWLTWALWTASLGLAVAALLKKRSCGTVAATKAVASDAPTAHVAGEVSTQV